MSDDAKVCKICAAPFTGRGEVIVCSVECGVKYSKRLMHIRRERRQLALMPVPKQTCVACGSEFLSRAPLRHCSEACRDEWHNNRRRTDSGTNGPTGQEGQHHVHENDHQDP